MQEGNLKERYFKTIRNGLKNSSREGNIYEVPKLTKIVVNTSFGRLSPDQKTKEQIVDNLAKITGQKPVFTIARAAIAGFKIRKGQVIGAKVTLRGEKMYHFFEKLVSVVIPRLRDFRGMSDKSFDGKGNYTVGFQEMNLFPEVEYSRSEKGIGLEITICTSAKGPKDTKKLLTEFGMAFANREEKETVSAQETK
ncbi:MAG: 50S ribosomal protein L5 [Candidatus Woykebacteria bacterium]